MTTTLTRWGLWAIPVAGVLTILPWLGIFFGGGGGTAFDPSRYAQSATSPASAIVGNLYVIGLLRVLFGVLAIYALLANTPVRGWAAFGMILGVVALITVSGIWVLITYVDAALGDLYLAGNQAAGEAFKSMSGGNWSPRFIPLFIVGAVAGLLAAISLGVALWRSGRFPKWLAVVFALAFLGSVASGPVVTLVAALLLIVAGVFIARQALNPGAAYGEDSVRLRNRRRGLLGTPASIETAKRSSAAKSIRRTRSAGSCSTTCPHLISCGTTACPSSCWRGCATTRTAAWVVTARRLLVIVFDST